MKVIELIKALNEYDGNKEIHLNGAELETVNLVLDTSNDRLSLYPNGLPKDNKYELKYFPRAIAEEITNVKYTVLQDAISYSTDMGGNLVLIVNLYHEDSNTMYKKNILKEVEKGIIAWGWLK